MAHTHVYFTALHNGIDVRRYTFAMDDIDQDIMLWAINIAWEQAKPRYRKKRVVKILPLCSMVFIKPKFEY